MAGLLIDGSCIKNTLRNIIRFRLNTPPGEENSHKHILVHFFILSVGQSFSRLVLDRSMEMQLFSNLHLVTLLL